MFKCGGSQIRFWVLVIGMIISSGAYIHTSAVVGPHTLQAQRLRSGKAGETARLAVRISSDGMERASAKHRTS